MYASIAAIRKANRAAGQHWFDPSAMRFFNTVIESGVIRGHYFITSDRMETSDPKRYTVRVASNDGRVTTFGDLCQYPTVDEAHRAILTNT